MSYIIFHSYSLIIHILFSLVVFITFYYFLISIQIVYIKSFESSFRSVLTGATFP